MPMPDEDKLCDFCGEPNDFDEDGFFYLWPERGMTFEEGKPACKACRDGEPGKKHDKLHGKGNGNR
jgi:hypothetical protein